MNRLRSSNWLLIGLVAGMILLALAGVALLVIYFSLSREPAASDAWASPLAGVRAEAVAPDLAVLTLAGETDERIIRAALDADETETAYATLAHSMLLTDNLRSGAWLLLARQLQAGDPARAAVAYQAVLDLAALGPSVGDMGRADLSMLAARGFAGLGKDKIARMALAQAENIARYSVMLLPAQRRTLLGEVADTYQALGDPAAARTIRERLDAYAVGPGITVGAGSQVIPTLRGSVVLPEAVVSAMAARQNAAADLAARWLSLSGSGRDSGRGSGRDALIKTLGDALAAEDAAREAFYGTADQLSLADRLALLHDKLAWLAVKYRVAQRGYGVSLAPEWEAQADALAAALSSTYTELINGYGQQLDTLDATEAGQARVELLRQGVLWTRLGLFPDANAEGTLSAQLSEASRRLWTRQGNAGLAVVGQDVDGRRFYLLSGAEPGAAQQ
jgi:hypothetical protein